VQLLAVTVHLKNVELLKAVNERRNILHMLKSWKVNWIAQILGRNCLLKHAIEERKKEGEK
jgi:hypothetical protein